MQKLSTGLVDAIAGTSSLITALADCIIEVRSGSQPTTADSAVAGTLLWTATLNGDGTTGLDFETVSPGGVQMPADSMWTGKAVADGTAGWYRVKKKSGDTNAASTTAIRIDGSIGSDMIVNTTAITSGIPQIITSFKLQFNQG